MVDILWYVFKDGEAREKADSGDEGDNDKEERAPEEGAESGVFQMRDKLQRLMEAEDPDVAAAVGILESFVDMYDNVTVKDIVWGQHDSLGMLVRKLRKHSDDEISVPFARCRCLRDL